jgi:hypothetical protein
VPVEYPPDDRMGQRHYWGLVAEWVVYSFREELGEDLAQELTQEAICQALPGGSRSWDPGGKVPCPIHVSWIVKDLASNHWKRADTHRVDRGFDEQERAGDSTRNPEKVALQKERRGQVADALREEFADSPAVQPVLELMLAGVMSLEEHLARSGLAPVQVTKARARVAAFIRDFTERRDAAIDSSPLEATS